MVLWESVNGVFTASASWLSTPEFMDKFEWFPFIMTVVGVFLGARYAQRIAERSKLRSEMKQEMREINTAIVVAVSISNLAYALKKQHIKKIKDSHDADCERLRTYREKQKQGIPQPPFPLSPNLNSLNTLSAPTQNLSDIVLDRLSVTGRALATVTAIGDAVHNLNHAITRRNEILEKMKADDLPEGAQLEHIYFGEPYASGKANNEYGGFVSAMALYVNNVLFFSVKLCEDLAKYGKPIAESYQKKFGGELPDITEPLWDKAKKEGMLPSDDEYKDWLSGFYIKPKTKRSGRQRLVDGVKRLFSF